MAVSLGFDMFANDPFFRSFLGDVASSGPAVGPDGKPLHNPHVIRVDVYERDDKFVILADVPGVTKDQVKVAVDGDTLKIGVEGQEITPTDEEGNKIVRWLRSDRSPIYAPRTIRLPAAADLTKVQAKLDQGVLQLDVDKKKEQGPKAIDVK